MNLGNGDGTFRKGSRFGHFIVYPLQIVVGDFNGDGNLDLIVSEFGGYVFLGNGDGTFKRPVHYAKWGGGGLMLTADFNGDGRLDLVAGSTVGLAVLLGNGDGTFQKPRKIASVSNFGCSFGPSILVSDFNADGKADLAYCERDQTNGKLWIILGNGDGTFKKPFFIPIQNGIYGFSFTAGDFNSDGKTDLIVNYNITNSLSETDLYLGNGNGTFQQKKVVKLPGAPNFNAEDGIVPGDFNSDGLLDFIFQQPGDVAIFVQK